MNTLASRDIYILYCNRVVFTNGVRYFLASVLANNVGNFDTILI